MMEMNLFFMIQNVKVENEIYKIDEIVRIIERSTTINSFEFRFQYKLTYDFCYIIHEG